MKAKEFVSKWGEDNMTVYNANMLSKRGVSAGDQEYLSKYGLPESAAPNLNFELISIEDMSFLFDDYYYLGYTGNGDWICIQNSSGKLLIVDHEIYGEDEETFDEEEEEEEGDSSETEDEEEFEGILLMNSSLEALYACLLAYRDFVQKHISSDSAEYRKELNNLEKTLVQIDRSAMNGDGFWSNALYDLL